MLQVTFTPEAFEQLKRLLAFIPETTEFKEAPGIFRASLLGGIDYINHQLDQAKVV